jgi:hypothetical protein
VSSSLVVPPVWKPTALRLKVKAATIRKDHGIKAQKLQGKPISTCATPRGAEASRASLALRSSASFAFFLANSSAADIPRYFINFQNKSCRRKFSEICMVSKSRGGSDI